MKQYAICVVGSLVYAILYFCFGSQTLYTGGIIIQPYYIIGIPLGIGIVGLMTKIIGQSNEKYFWISTIIMLVIFIVVRFILGVLLDGVIRGYYASGYSNLFELFKYLSRR